ncbi:MAG: hypothetical protein ACKONH_10605 [Planctomycetia bacterium]
MIRRFAIAVLAVAATAFVAAPAEAGGGGTKRTVSIKTSNASGESLCVFGIKSGDLPTTVKQAQKKFGAVVIADGGTKTVMVPSGKGVLIAVAFDPVTGALIADDAGLALYNLNAGAKTTALISDDAGTPVVQIPKITP